MKYDICNDQQSKQITSESGIITSSNYPTYLLTTGVCEKTIVAREGNSVNLWIEDIRIPERDGGRM